MLKELEVLQARVKISDPYYRILIQLFQNKIDGVVNDHTRGGPSYTHRFSRSIY